MKGEVIVNVKNKHISFRLRLERNITILTGDSGTGKTKLINMVRNYSELGKSSGVTLSCKKKCIVLEGRNWEHDLQNTRNSIIFIEESTPFLSSRDFAALIQGTDNYYVFVTREPLPQIPYSIDSIKRIVKNGDKPIFENIYSSISIKDIEKSPYDMIITEDSRSGFQLFHKFADKIGILCVSANGKSNLLPTIHSHRKKNLLVIADAAALGSEIRDLAQYQERSETRIDFFLPECFEWLVLKSAIFAGKTSIHEILSKPIDYIDCIEYFSWERFFVQMLIEQSKDIPTLKYDKSHLAVGYLSDKNIESIIQAMRSKK